MKTSILVCVILLVGTSGHAECPYADLTGDCYVGLADLAVMVIQWESEPNVADFSVMASQWMADGIPGIVFVDIPGGTFLMGDSFGEGIFDELPVHTVTISTFRMSKYEVTNAQYAEYLNAANADALIKISDGIVYASSDDTNSQPYFDTYSYDSDSQINYTAGTFAVRSKSGRDMSNDPVVEVSWYGAKAFCDYYGYRLPTEAEWEYAARGGLSGQRFPWGDTISHSQANYYSYRDGGVPYYPYDVSPTPEYHPDFDDDYDQDFEYPFTAPVETFAANAYGLCNMADNVWEWCNDRYDSSYYNSSPQQDPQGPVSGDFRVYRGGSWYNEAVYCRTACRHGDEPVEPVERHGFSGFRPALNFQ